MNIILVKLSERLSCTSPVLLLPVVFFAPLPVTEFFLVQFGERLCVLDRVNVAHGVLHLFIWR